MQKSRGGMGTRKHRVSGKSQQSPKVRHRMKLEAERNERKAKPKTCKHKSVIEAVRGSGGTIR